MKFGEAIARAAGLAVDEHKSVQIAQLASEARVILSEGREAARELQRARSLIADLQQRLSEPYVFSVFPQYTVAYGLHYTFRQRWEPKDFQVGRLVATIPLAPRESRKIQKRLVIHERRQARELKKSVRNLLSEETTANTVTSQVAKRAEESNSVNATAEGSYGNDEIYQVSGQVSTGRDTKKLSEDTKNSIRAKTLKAAQELREERQIEIDTTSDTTSESTSSGEISNPNDEISVTYLYYELQRQFQVSETLHKVTPVVFVAAPFPKPGDIDRDWLIEHEWMLRRVILDDGFLAAFDLLKKNPEGEKLALKAQQTAMAVAFRAVAETRDHIATQERLRDRASRRVDAAVARLASVQAGEQSEGVIENVQEWFFGSPSGESTDAAATQREAAENVFARIDDSIAGARGRLAQLESALETATREYVQSLKTYMDAVQQMFSLRIHIKQNITYYMQAIWKHEFRDQRYFRLFDKAVPFVPIDPTAVTVTTDAQGSVSIQLPAAPAQVQRRLDEIADLDNLLGFKGNYLIFPLKEPCHITTSMLAGFMNAELQLVDPDASSTGVSIGELTEARAVLTEQKAAATSADKNADVSAYDKQIEKINVLIDAMDNDSDIVRAQELVIVSTDMLYIEALPGANPVMENFKLTHRQLDADLAREKVRHEAINNVRMEALLRSGSYIDPDIDKQIYIKSDAPLTGTFSATGGSPTPP